MQIDWQETTAIATFGLLCSSLGAILYASKQLHHERNYRAVANLERQLSFFLSESFFRARRALAEDRLIGERLKPLDAENPPLSIFEVLDFYEHLGLLVKKGHLDLYDVWHTFYEWAQPVYSDLRPVVEEDSELADHYSDLRKLMARMDLLQRSRMAKRGRHAHKRLWTEERIVEHYLYEIGIGKRPRHIYGGMPAMGKQA